MAGLRVAVVQLDRDGSKHFVKAVVAVSDKDGRVTFERLPADQGYAIFTVAEGGPQKFVITTKKFKAYADRQERDLGDLSVITPLKITGRIELPAGQSLPTETEITLGRDPAWDLISVPVGKDGRFVIDGLPPEIYEAAIHTKGFKLDTDRLPFQMLEDSSFGLRVRESMGDLRTPLIRTVPKVENDGRLHDTRSVPHNQDLRGVVVDLQGKPVAGAGVTTTLEDSTPVEWSSSSRDAKSALDPNCPKG